MKSLRRALCVLPAAFCLVVGADLDNGRGAKSVPDFAAAGVRRAEYRGELEQFRNEFGGTRALPAHPFFLFGMGLRPKFLYKAGTLFRAESGAVFRQWEGAEEVILPPDYAVVLRTRTDEIVRLVEDERGFWIEDRAGRERVPGTDQPVCLPRFDGFCFPQVMRVLHQEPDVRGGAGNESFHSRPLRLRRASRVSDQMAQVRAACPRLA
jgi:hypothetical protein